MTKIEALELELAAQKMVEDTAFNWWEVIKFGRVLMPKSLPICNAPRQDFELALSIIEGKPVWKGDKLYDLADGQGFTVSAEGIDKLYLHHVSWNPPTPKTVMVEMTIEDAKACAWENSLTLATYDRRRDACRKALEKLKMKTREELIAAASAFTNEAHKSGCTACVLFLADDVVEHTLTGKSMELVGLLEAAKLVVLQRGMMNA